jgi:putative endonuclease
MYFVYILLSTKDGKLYIGCTKDLNKRLLEHNSGEVVSTKLRYPLKLIYYECMTNKKDAFAREQWLKTGWGRNQIEKTLSNFFKEQGKI